MSIATQKGDKGMTGLLYGGRVRKDSARIECNGAVDEAQAALGLARSIVRSVTAAARTTAAKAAAKRPPLSGADVDAVLVEVERDLWVLMAEVATSDANRRKLVAGTSLVSREMVDALTDKVHELEALGIMPKDFVVPGENQASAALDVARTVVRRAERLAVAVKLPDTSQVVPYLNRLSDLCWLLARAVEAEHVTAKSVKQLTVSQSR